MDAVDLCVPTHLHEEMIHAAAEAGKHIICEKPLTGYFGQDLGGEDIGFEFPGKGCLRASWSCSRIRMAIQKHGIQFCYAENWIYAPSLTKIKRIVKVSGGTIMDIRAEESHSGSHAAYSRQWKTSGGGPFFVWSPSDQRRPAPKAFRGMLRDGKPIRPKSITGEVGHHTHIPSFQRESKKWLVSSWEDVEDWSAIILTFEDHSKATIFASDGVLGGIRNTMQVYLSNAVAYREHQSQ